MNKVETIKHGFKQESEKILSDLRTLGDELRLKAHLAGAETRDTWNKLEPQLQQFETRIERATEAAMGELRVAGKELKTNLERLCHDLRKQ